MLPVDYQQVHADFILKMFIGLLYDVLGDCLISSGESGLYEVVASLLSGRVSLNVCLPVGLSLDIFHTPLKGTYQ